MIVITAVLSACAPRETLYPLAGREVPRLRAFPADFQAPLSHETDQRVGGFGGAIGAEKSAGLTRTPVIFVHGNTVSANFWLPAREYFLKKGYQPDELWALSYGWNSVRAFDSNDLSVPTLERFVTEVQRYLSEKAGRPVRQVDIIAHSLGVTLVRQWMMQENAFHRVRNFIGVSGANHGVWTARRDTRGQNRIVAFELMPRSPWLNQLNRPGETAGATRFMTLYDGTGYGDVLFPDPYQHSSRLEGAYNLAFNLKNNRYYDHLELAREPETMDAMIEFLRKAPEPLPQATPPELMQVGDVVRTTQPDSEVHCAGGGHYPSLPHLGAGEIALRPGEISTCFAHSARTGLASPMARFKFGEPAPSVEPLSLAAAPAAGAYEQPQKIALTASDPDAYIVYTTSGAPPQTGSPLYSAPIYVAGPVILQAMAIAPDGRRSKPVKLDLDISLELIEARHVLQRQFDEAETAVYRGLRKKGS